MREDNMPDSGSMSTGIMSFSEKNQKDILATSAQQKSPRCREIELRFGSMNVSCDWRSDACQESHPPRHHLRCPIRNEPTRVTWRRSRRSPSGTALTVEREHSYHRSRLAKNRRKNLEILAERPT
jgi:hypothetical protein